MDMAGEDLKRYLIVPLLSSSSSCSLLPSSSPVAGSEEKQISTDTKYEQTASTTNKAEKRKMEVDTHTPLPTSFGGAHAEAMDASTPLDGVISMDDFMIQNKHAHEAQKLVQETKQSAPPPSKKPKTPNGKTTPLIPVAVGARSSRHTILLHEKYQALGIPQPLFTYGGGSETGWTVSVSFPGLDDAEELQGLKFEEEKKFNSKQEAKEAMSQKALGVLEELEKEGRVKKGGKGKGKKGGGEVEGKVGEKGKEEKEKGPGENYVGKLLGMFLLLFSSMCYCKAHVSITQKYMEILIQLTNTRVPARNGFPSTNIYGLSIWSTLLLYHHHRRRRPTLRLHLKPILLQESRSTRRRPPRCRTLQNPRYLAHGRHRRRRHP